jgi:hypothetical protein
MIGQPRQVNRQRQEHARTRLHRCQPFTPRMRRAGVDVHHVERSAEHAAIAVLDPHSRPRLQRFFRARASSASTSNATTWPRSPTSSAKIAVLARSATARDS